MKVLITGANGFIGKNLVAHFAERKCDEVVCFARKDSVSDFPKLLADVDFIFHLAGVNRSKEPEDFFSGNVSLTQALCAGVAALGRNIPIIYTSSTQADQDNAYGDSKRGAEEALLALSKEHGVSVHIFRLPNVFGKWSRPNYNSAIATFCHNIARDLPIHINDPSAIITLIYIDDVVESFIKVMEGVITDSPYVEVHSKYESTVGQLADQIQAFKDSRATLITEQVGTGLVRALYSTYVSYLSPDDFSYLVPQYGDSRGVFVEMLKTKDAGQFSYFTAHPGITRGGHYHHSKTEKFLVIKGSACFRFRHIQSGVFHELHTSGEHPQVVETVPGWSHDITNAGTDEMIVMLWANEIFDRERPDTFACPVGMVT
jgi:UDP-2-acetamido-2,6-beta-L-arabino-hexul-4-ose reductase